MKAHDSFSIWELIFLPADNLPDDDTTVLASDGHQVGLAYHSDNQWHMENGSTWPGVIGWADLPDPGECILDLIKI